MALTVTTTTVEQVKLKPQIAKKLKLKLNNYAALTQEMRTLKAAMALELEGIEGIRAETGVDKLEFDGAKITRVSGTQKKLNHAKLIQLGCAATWIEQAMEEKPKKAYTKVTLPGEKDYDDER